MMGLWRSFFSGRVNASLGSEIYVAADDVKVNLLHKEFSITHIEAGFDDDCGGSGEGDSDILDLHFIVSASGEFKSVGKKVTKLCNVTFYDVEDGDVRIIKT
jgi:hypothetical protein